VARRPVRNGDDLWRQAAEAPRVAGRVVCRDECGLFGELVGAHTVLKNDDDAFLGQLDASHRC